MLVEYSGEILIATGLLTMGAFAAFLFPTTISHIVFGIITPDAGTRFIVQHWALLVFLVGALLVCAGRHPEMQVPVMAVAATDKLVGSGMVLAGPLRHRAAALAIVAADSIMGMMYLLMLLS